MAPTIDAYIICWNEEKLIRHTLRHYSSFCRKITLIDNHSSDNTLLIVRNEFPAVGIDSYESEECFNEEQLMKVKNNCWKNSSADYVIVCDTDEFLYVPNMQQSLAELKEKEVVVPVIIGYNMGAESFPDNFAVPIYEQVRTGIRDGNFDKQILFSPHAIKEINYSPGSHGCNPIYKKQRLVDKIIQFYLLHYKYLGRQYLYEKHLAYSQRISDFNIRNNYALDYLKGNAHIDECFEWMDRHLYQVI